ncbi:MAG TPA: hypothetical protein VHB97_24870, partial [Polyangia bacterium]|nr:hypothetical protein [Polyangia bacterium]
MRTLGALVLSCLIPATAFADTGDLDDEPVPNKAAQAQPAAMATETATPTTRVDRRLPSETGELRSARVSAPSPGRVDVAAGVAREHDVAPPHAVSATATDNDVMAELAARQMKRHQRALDICVASAHKRAPTATGSLTLDFDVSDRKVKSVRVTDDGVRDFTLASCVTSVARSFTFSLAAAH